MSKLQFYYDGLIVETFLSEGLVKQADGSGASKIFNAVAQYVKGKITPGHEVESVINILGPGILAALGFPFMAGLIKLSQMFFGLNVGKILADAVEKIKELLIPGQTIAPEHIDNIVDSAIEANYGSNPTEEDVKKLQSLSLHDTQMLKLAFNDIFNEISLEDLNSPLNKRAQLVSALSGILGVKRKTASVIGKIIGFIIKSVLISAGFMLGGDLLNKVMDRKDVPSSSNGLPELNPSTTKNISLPGSHQDLFKINPGYVEENLNKTTGWIEMVPPEQIGSQISQWAQDIYPDLKGKDGFIQSSPIFQKVVEVIKEYNSNNTSKITFMPRVFNSRKKVVDTFIDDLANKASNLNIPSPDAKKPFINA